MEGSNICVGLFCKREKRGYQLGYISGLLKQVLFCCGPNAGMVFYPIEFGYSYSELIHHPGYDACRVRLSVYSSFDSLRPWLMSGCNTHCCVAGSGIFETAPSGNLVVKFLRPFHHYGEVIGVDPSSWLRRVPCPSLCL